jgi:hypothetical protein
VSRVSILMRRPWRTLGVLSAALLALGLAVGSSAVLTSSSSNGGNSFSAKNFQISSTSDGTALMTLTNVKPSDPASTGDVVIHSGGDLSGTLALHVAPGDTAGPNGGNLSSVLDVTITDVTDNLVDPLNPPVPVYSGKLGAMPDTPIDADPSTPAQDPFSSSTPDRTYHFSVSFPSGGTPTTNTTGDNAYKGSSISARYDWRAVQAP